MKCFCGTGIGFDGCCGRFVTDGRPTSTAEELMRSRYSAFCLRDEAYLRHTWGEAYRPPAVEFVEGQQWTGLEIVDTTEGGLLDTTGTVHFRARYRRGGRAGVLDTVSTFGRESGRWVYLDDLDD